MPRDMTLRQRIAKNSSTENPADDAPRSHNRARNDITFRKAAKVIVICVIFGLTYAYYSSPTSALVTSPIDETAQLIGATIDNDDLTNGVRILQELHGPESAVVDPVNGDWYCGTHDGRIVRIQKANTPAQTITNVTSKLVNGPYTAGGEIILRRSLGMRLRERTLYVADTYQGIFAINLGSYEWVKVVGYNDLTPPLQFADDLALTKDGNMLYFTDMSTKWPYHLMSFSLAEGECSGRVIEVDLKTKVIRVVRNEMCMPNGIELNPDDSILAVSESPKNSLVLLSKDSGEIISTIPMPGNSDNIRRSKSGGYWIAIPMPAIRFLQLTRNLPFLRDIVSRLLGPMGLYIFPNLSTGMVVKLNEHFEPVSIHRDVKGEVSRVITEVVELDDGFLLCSFLTHGFVKVKEMSNNN